MSKSKPTWCPFLDAETRARITCVESCECKGRSHKKRGSSEFCIGNTQIVSFDIDGCDHTNGYCFCTNAPFATPDHDWKVSAIVVNRQDMMILHQLIHAAIADDGFMAIKEEEDAEN